MSNLKKLLKTTDGLQDEVDALVEKEVAKAGKAAEKAFKTLLKDLTTSVKDHDGVDKAATKVVVELIKNTQVPF